MGRFAFVVSLCALLLHPLAAAAAQPTGFSIRIDGKILRKTSGKLVFSTSEFELDGSQAVTIASRRTGESRVVGLSSVYGDSCYSETLPPELLERIDEDDWAPTVVWNIPDNLAAMTARLAAIHEYQNRLRLELGRALLDEDVAGSKVSSRISLNKIEKFNRIGAVLAGRILEKGKGKESFNPFRYPIRIQTTFSPFAISSRTFRSPVDRIREVLFWDVHRTVVQQLGVSEKLVDLVFDAPSTVRRFIPTDGMTLQERSEFAPTVIIGAESIDAVMYIARQDIEGDVRNLFRMKRYRDEFIRDRPALDVFVNDGKVVAIAGRRLAVSFVPPFMKPGETVRVVVDENAEEEIPVVLESPKAGEGYTLTAELPDGAIARVRPGMTVRRK